MQSHVPLAPYTSLAAGGAAEHLCICTSHDELLKALAHSVGQQLWLLGYGANALISDAGLQGNTLLIRTSDITRQDDLLVADAGVWWDDLAQFALREKLWGLELMSAIPGSVGAAVVGNIAAYGQAVADTLAWVEVFDHATNETKQLQPDDLALSYRHSAFQSNDFASLVILRAAFALHDAPMKPVEYQVVLDVAAANGYDLNTLGGRRQAILATRKAAGSLWDYHTPGNYPHTAGSFFRNPLVDEQKAEELMSYDETGKSAEALKLMNRIHGGAQKRVSAAHILLAAGFQRGQSWGPVRLHPDHILKIENTGGASAQQIYTVAQEIITTVRDTLGIDLVPEVRFLGSFE